MQPIKSVENENYVLEVYRDELVETPREWDNLGTMITYHNHYILGEKELNGGYPSMYDEFKEEVIYGDLGLEVDDDGLADCIMEDEVVYFPLFLFDHSGLRMDYTPFSCRWDSGQVGYIYVTHEKVKEHFNIDKVDGEHIKKAKDILKAEVKTMDSYLSGDIYYICLKEKKTCKCCEYTSMEVIESIGGFYGYDGIKEGIKEYLPKDTHSLADMLD